METINLASKGIEMLEGVALRGKIESYSNAGLIEDPANGESTKVVIVQISFMIPQTDVIKMMNMENDDNQVNLLIQAIPKPKH